MTHIGQRGFNGPVTGENFFLKDFKTAKLLEGGRGQIFIKVTHIGQRGINRPVRGRGQCLGGDRTWGDCYKCGPGGSGDSLRGDSHQVATGREPT